MNTWLIVLIVILVVVAAALLWAAFTPYPKMGGNDLFQDYSGADEEFYTPYGHLRTYQGAGEGDNEINTMLDKLLVTLKSGGSNVKFYKPGAFTESPDFKSDDPDHILSAIIFNKPMPTAQPENTQPITLKNIDWIRKLLSVTDKHWNKSGNLHGKELRKEYDQTVEKIKKIINEAEFSLLKENISQLFNQVMEDYQGINQALTTQEINKDSSVVKHMDTWEQYLSSIARKLIMERFKGKEYTNNFQDLEELRSIWKELKEVIFSRDLWKIYSDLVLVLAERLNSCQENIKLVKERIEQLDAAEQQYREMLQTLDKTEQENDVLTQTIKELRNKQSVLEQEIAGLQGENAKLREEIDDQKQKSELELQKIQATHDKEMKTKQDGYLIILNKVNLELRTAKESLDASRIKNKEIKDNNAKLVEELEAAVLSQAQSEKKIKEYEQQILTLKQQIQTANAATAAEADISSEARIKLQEAERRLKEMEDSAIDVQNLRKQLSEANVKIQQLQGQLAAAPAPVPESRIRELEERIKVLESENINLRKAVVEANAEVEEYEDMTDLAQAAESQMRQRYLEAYQQKQAAEKTLAEALKARDNAEKKARESQQAAAVAEAARKVAEASQQAAEAARKAAVAEKQAAEAARQAAEAAKVAAEAAKVAAEVAAEQRVRAVRTNLQGQIVALRKTVDNLKARVDALAAKLAAKQVELDDCNVQVAELTAKLEEALRAAESLAYWMTDEDAKSHADQIQSALKGRLRVALAADPATAAKFIPLMQKMLDTAVANYGYTLNTVPTPLQNELFNALDSIKPAGVVAPVYPVDLKGQLHAIIDFYHAILTRDSSKKLISMEDLRTIPL